MGKNIWVKISGSKETGFEASRFRVCYQQSLFCLGSFIFKVASSAHLVLSKDIKADLLFSPTNNSCNNGREASIINY